MVNSLEYVFLVWLTLALSAADITETFSIFVKFNPGRLPLHRLLRLQLGSKIQRKEHRAKPMYYSTCLQFSRSLNIAITVSNYNRFSRLVLGTSPLEVSPLLHHNNILGGLNGLYNIHAFQNLTKYNMSGTSVHFPPFTYLPSNQGVGTVVMKN